MRIWGKNKNNNYYSTPFLEEQINVVTNIEENDCVPKNGQSLDVF